MLVLPQPVQSKLSSTPAKLVALDLSLPPVPKPDYEAEVLAPLHAEQARIEALRLVQAAELARQASLASQATPTPSPAVYGQPDDWYKAFIYNHESGNDPTRWNSSGCLGLGQACPASKLLAVCPNMDYACEDAWFTNYALSRYGSWAGAYGFWIAHRWW